MRTFALACIAMVMGGLSGIAHGERQPPPSGSAAALKNLSVEELMNIEVTSASRSPESLGRVATALTVVTGKDIQRSGATTIPEALRLIPGIHIARRNANSWAVSARGFSSVNSEKLLVLSDTRSIYTPLYSGVFWDVQDYLLADIERIEIIRGPGAALWGSNAVNGVINITTKDARDTQGLYLETVAGTEERARTGLRYGSRAGDTHYRIFGQYTDRDASFSSDPARSDDWRLGHVGFRADGLVRGGDSWTLQGDLYQGSIGQLAPAITVGNRPGAQGNLEVDVSGGNVLGRWRRSLDEHSDLQLRAYYDRTYRDDPSFRDELDTVDLDFQHRLALPRQSLIWGANYRFTANRNEGKGLFAVTPSSSQDQLFGAFIQDQFSISDALRLTVGTKIEHNDFSGFEIQPNVRAAWNPTSRHTLWSAVSRAVRVPTRLERDIAIDATDPAGNPVVRLIGNEDFGSEELLAYELGYRWQSLETLSLDLAVFHNRYEKLASLELGQTFVRAGDGRTIIPILNRNLTQGRAQGLEALVTFFARENWRLAATYSFFELHLDPAGQDLNRGILLEGATPRHQFGLQSSLDLPSGFRIDARLRRLSAVRSSPEIGGPIPAYAELDVSLGWQASDRMQLSIVGQNLLHDRHVEFGAPAARGGIERSVYAKLTWVR